MPNVVGLALMLDGISLGLAKTTCIITDPEWVRAVEEELRGKLATIHGGLKTARLEKATLKEGTVFIRCSSRFCTNVEREHTASSIYLHIDKFGVMRQRCYSAGCRGYASAPQTLSTEAMTNLGLADEQGIPLSFITQTAQTAQTAQTTTFQTASNAANANAGTSADGAADAADSADPPNPNTRKRNSVG